ILGLFLCASCLPLALSHTAFTIPPELKSAVVKVPINATSCSVTCGVGVRLEEICELSSTGERSNCTMHRSHCLASWTCGLLHFTIPAGEPFQLSCLASDTLSFGSGAYSYTWKLAPGLITTNDLLFKPFQNPSAVLRFSPAGEANAGTYRCDVRLSRTAKVVERIYFGIRVIQKDLADLDFERSLTWEQKLAAKEQEGKTENPTRGEVHQQQHFRQGGLAQGSLLGIGCAGMAIVLISMAL
ncbi:Transmembrane protein 81, partial [Merops nubicus]